MTKRHRTYPAALLALAMLFLSACAKEDITAGLEVSRFQSCDLNMQAEEPTLLFDTHYVYDAVRLTAEEDAFSAEDYRVTATLCNASGSTLGGEEAYQLEILSDGQWYELSREHVSFIEIAYEIPPGDFEKSYSLRHYGDTLRAGTYRIVQEYGMEGLTGSLVVFVEFEVPEDCSAPKKEQELSSSAVSYDPVTGSHIAETITFPDGDAEVREHPEQQPAQ